MTSRRHPQASALGACILAVLASAAAHAQQSEQAAEATTPKKAEAAKDQEVAEVVVTGSRLRRTEFTAASPVQIITTEQTSLEGLMSAAEILQQSTLASGSQQINDQTTGFVTENGPGANTLSLRGLGASRTLLLLNGRRLSPAGARGQLAAADLNVLPESIIQRIEILKDGASSVYGSDAIAGVVNIITRKGFDGGNVGIEGNYITQGGGESRQVSAAWGKSWDQGGISLSVEYFKREPLRLSDRDFLSCAQDRITNVTSNPNSIFAGSVGQLLDVIDPATGQPKCWNVQHAYVSAGGGVFTPNTSAVTGGGLVGLDRAGWQRVAVPFISTNPTTPTVTNRLPNATNAQRLAAWYALRAALPGAPERQLSRTFNSPVTRKSAYLEGSWEFNPAFNVYAEALVNQRDSWQANWRQFFPTVAASNPNNPFGAAAQFVTVIPTNADQSVDFNRYVVGANGDFSGFGGNSWKYDLFIQRSESKASYTNDIIYNDRVNAYNILSATGTVLGVGATCNPARVTISGPFTSCPAVNWLDPTMVTTGQFSSEAAAFLFGRETGNTKYNQTLYGASVNGNLFNLPAGAVSIALGFEGRKDSIDDTPGINARSSNLWGQTSAGRTVGSDKVKEFFGETEIPLLSNKFLAKQLSLSGSARWTDYDSYGSDTTYKIGLNWQIADAVRLRGSYGTSFRAPALYELYLQNQTGFLNQSQVDPCIRYGLSSNTLLQQNCRAVGLPEDYAGAGGSARIITGGGAGNLAAETSKAYTAGIVLTPTDWPVNFAADWWRIEVSDQVSSFSAGTILSACYTSEVFPNDPFCSLFERDTSGQFGQNLNYGNVTNVRSSYVNIAQQVAEGVDYNLRWQQKLGSYNFTANAQVTYMLRSTTQVFQSFDPESDLGDIYSPQWVSSIDMRLDRGAWTFNWSIDAFSATNNDKYYVGLSSSFNSSFPDCGLQATQTVTCVQGKFDRSTNLHITHDVSVRYSGDNWSTIIGVQNLLNDDPPTLSTNSGAIRVGNAVAISNYDVLGRRFFLSAEYRF